MCGHDVPFYVCFWFIFLFYVSTQLTDFAAVRLIVQCDLLTVVYILRWLLVLHRIFFPVLYCYRWPPPPPACRLVGCRSGRVDAQWIQGRFSFWTMLPFCSEKNTCKSNSAGETPGDHRQRFIGPPRRLDGVLSAARFLSTGTSAAWWLESEFYFGFQNQIKGIRPNRLKAESD